MLRNNDEINERLFRLFDSENEGKISYIGFKRIAIEVGENINENELKEIFEEADQDKDGFISKKEFIRIMKKGNDPFSDSESDGE